MSGPASEGDARFIVGIDLGTTNSVLAYTDTGGGEGAEVRLLEVPQLTSPGTVEARSQLPSFLLIPRREEVPAKSIRLPWGAPEAGHVVGTLASKRAAESPDRVVSSAKSWLCNANVDRKEAILPWVEGGAETGGTERVSPLQASTAYLAHLRAAWDESFGKSEAAPLAEQDVYLTVPASFDAAARELTVEAAKAAGLARVHLIEEPQAAVYAWLDQAGEDWREQVAVGDVLLVCDVGGGPTDLSLVLVDEEEGGLSLTRVAVGNHILLGGDNMDLALAFAVRSSLAKDGKRLDPWQLRGLVQSCRVAKEGLLSAEGPDAVPISVLGRGKKLIGGTLRSELTRTQVNELLLDGFFPKVASDARVARDEAAGLSEIGLPFAADAAITRHLADFLGAHQGAVEAAQGKEDAAPLPTALLFNGGVMAAEGIRARIEDVVGDWAKSAKAPPPRVLSGADLAHAVARGAACYGRARRGTGVRIRGGTARSYYVGIASSMPAVPGHPAPVKGLCVVPFGVEEGTELEVPGSEFGLLVGQTGEFRFFASTTRDEDAPGQVLDEFDTGDLEELAPLHVELEGESGERVPVRLRAHVTEIGTLELFFVGRGKGPRWRLEFTVREAGGRG